jgi:hypothetical protein
LERALSDEGARDLVHNPHGRDGSGSAGRARGAVNSHQGRPSGLSRIVIGRVTIGDPHGQSPFLQQRLHTMITTRLLAAHELATKRVFARHYGRKMLFNNCQRLPMITISLPIYGTYATNIDRPFVFG